MFYFTQVHSKLNVHTHFIFRTDWLSGGYQLLFFERSCEIDQGIIEGSTCTTQINDWSVFKDCSHFCDSNGCNNDKEIEMEFAALDENGFPVKKRSLTGLS